MISEKISDILNKYHNENYISFHMPGHKGKKIGYIPKLSDDITELYGMDDLHNPGGIIFDSMQLAKKLYHSSYTFFSTNGSTACNMAAIDTVTTLYDTILICQDAHISVQNIASIKYLNLQKILGSPILEDNNELMANISIEEIEKILNENPKIKAVFVTSPSYEGIISDIETIAKIAHSHNIPLIVDEAHGAHLALSKHFPTSALHLGADIVINSLHKTLPALTGTSLIHIGKNSKFIEPKLLQKNLLKFISTSPSYLLISSIDFCLHQINETGKKLFDNLHKNLIFFYESLKDLKNIYLLNLDDKHSIKQDKSRLVFLSKNKNLTGHKMAEILRSKYKIEMEKSCDSYLIGISTIADTKNDFKKLIFAIKNIDMSM